MLTTRRIGLGIGLLASLAIASSQVALVLAAPAPKAAVGTAYQTTGFAGIGGANYTVVADMVVPAGKYHVTAHGTVNNQTGVPVAYVSCNAYAGATLLDAGNVTVPDQYASFGIDGTADLPTGGTIKVECIAGAYSAPFPNVSVSLVAESVAAITILP
jgi:hypothetical protein